MEVKPGYKQTEVGVIPEEWEVVALGNLVKLQGGYSFRSEYFCDIGVPVIRISDIQDGAVATEGAICHPPVKIASDFLIHNGDFLVAMSGATTGKVGVFRNQTPAYQNQRVGRFVVHDNARTSSEFVGHLVRSHAFGSQLKVLLEQGAQPNVSGQQIESLLFPVPLSPPEQRAIATALSDVDGLLGGLDRLIAKKRDLKQAAMQQLLTGQTRLPGFHGEWDEKTLGQFAELKSGYAFRSEAYTAIGDFKIITIANVQDGFMDAAECNRILSIPRDLQAHQRLGIGDILISMTGNVGRVCRVAESNCLLNQRVGKLTPADFDADLLFLLLSQRRFITSMATKAKGGAQGNLSVADITEFQFAVPPTKAEQTAIAEVLTEMDLELAGLEQRREKTRALKQAMMQELLTGRTRLVPPTPSSDGHSSSTAS